jgi:replication-associated recombination protein RarA
MPELIDQYRPARWAEVVGQDKALKQLEQWRKRGGLLGRKIWISGKSGTGKTTIARLIAAEAADSTCVTELSAKALTVAEIREQFRILRCRALFGNGGRVLILNEAHLLRRDVVTEFLTLTEPDAGFPVYAILICTTTAEGNAKFEDAPDADTAAFLSRFGSKLPLAQSGIADAFAANCARIARAEGIGDELTDDELLKRCKRLAQDNRSNHREMLAQIDSGALTA